MATSNGRRPSPFFYVALVALLVGGTAAAFGGQGHPDYALKSNVVLRFEVGGVVFGITYAVLLVLYLAWHGRAPSKIGGGPASIEVAPQEVDGGPELDITMPPPTASDNEA